MSSNLGIVRELYAALGRQDMEAVLRIMHPEIVWVQNEGFPGGGIHVGTEAVVSNVFVKFKAEWDGWQAVVVEWLDAGEKIVALGEYRGTCRATGKSMKAAFAHVYTLADGRVVKFQQFTDTRIIAAARLESDDERPR